MPTASQRVLQSLELLRMVLLQVDLPTLFTAVLRVSRDWKYAVLSSDLLLERMFLEPLTISGNVGRIRPTQNPMVMHKRWMLHLLFAVNFDDTADLRRAREKGLPYPAHVPNGPSSVVPLEHLLHEVQRSLYNDPAFSRRRASWRRLLLQQPPITSFGLVVSRRSNGGLYDTETGMVQVPRGLRLGQLWDTMRSVLGGCRTRACFLRLVWWEPSVTPFDTEDWPMADEMVRLFDSGAHAVMLIGFSVETGSQAPKYVHEASTKADHSILRRCEDYEPLIFDMTRVPAFRVPVPGSRQPA